MSNYEETIKVIIAIHITLFLIAEKNEWHVFCVYVIDFTFYCDLLFFEYRYQLMSQLLEKRKAKSRSM